MIETRPSPCSPSRRKDASGTSDVSKAPEIVAEEHLARRILVATALAVPIGAVFFALLVAVAMLIAGQPALIPAAMGAGIGVLAGTFFGMWAGFVASVNELDRADLHPVTHANEAHA